MNNIVIFGTSGHAKVIVDFLSSQKNIKLIGFIDKTFDVEDEILGCNFLGRESSLITLMKSFTSIQG